jgi:formate dehydrogenase iron-sulfur subunit
MISNPCILNDVTRCIGCEACVDACKRTNGLPLEDPPPRVGGSRDRLSATRWTSVVRHAEGGNVRKQCRHCLEPACVSACPVGALQRTAEGAVIYDKSLCMGCRYCMMACPFGIPRYEWTSVSPSVRKCVFCYEEMRSGRLDRPACVTACPADATSFGDRDALIAEARSRTEAEPGRYQQQIWGLKEVGGTRVIYVAHTDLPSLGWRGPEALGSDPLPDLTWDALRKVPFEFFGMGGLMMGLWWIIERRQRLAGGESVTRRNETGTAPGQGGPEEGEKR